MGGRVGPRVGSGQNFCRQSRVGSGRVNVSSGRVQEKWPVDNSDLTSIDFFSLSRTVFQIFDFKVFQGLMLTFDL